MKPHPKTALAPQLHAAAGKERIVIVGAGLVGSMLAIVLARRGLPVEVFERGPDVRQIGTTAVRRSSINMSLCTRGLEALDRVGLGAAVLAHCVPAYGRIIHDPQGALTYQPYGSHGERTYSILRNVLGGLLIEHAERDYQIPFHFNTRLVDLDPATGTMQLENTTTLSTRVENATRIFGADGLFSAVRQRLQRMSRFNYSQHFLEHGYREITIPQDAGYSWMKKREAVHLWPRGGYMLLGLPNPDGSFVCALHLPLDGPLSFDALKSEAELLAFLTRNFPDAVDQTHDIAEQFFKKTTNHLTSVRCHPWVYEDKVALIGDAAHAVFPFYAQGVNSGFEDCVGLDDALDEHGDHWHAVLAGYQARRKPNADAIAELSQQHFTELAELVGQPHFQRQKQLEQRLTDLYPERFRSVYSLVTFTSTPYAEAQRQGRALAAAVDQLLTTPDVERIAKPELDRLVLSLRVENLGTAS